MEKLTDNFESITDICLFHIYISSVKVSSDIFLRVNKPHEDQLHQIYCQLQRLWFQNLFNHLVVSQVTMVSVQIPYFSPEPYLHNVSIDYVLVTQSNTIVGYIELRPAGQFRNLVSIKSRENNVDSVWQSGKKIRFCWCSSSQGLPFGLAELNFR